VKDAVKAQRRHAVNEFKAAAILDAAVRVFEAEGLEGASMRAIAQQAGYTAGAIYAYYPSKEALYAALLEDSLTRLTTAVSDAADPSGPAADRFRAAGLAFYDFYDANPRDLDLGFYLFRGGIKPRGLTAELDAALNAKLFGSLAPLTEAARELGADPASARTLTARAFAHASGLLLLDHTRRLQLFQVTARELLDQDLRHLTDVASHPGSEQLGASVGS
jgi:AcrR family transcriptional regulator